jgi:hypothetical protein
MWEWSHAQPVQNVRPSGVFAKVNRVRFTAQGNKFGACDGDGSVALWQAANASQPFFVSICVLNRAATGVLMNPLFVRSFGKKWFLSKGLKKKKKKLRDSSQQALHYSRIAVFVSLLHLATTRG